MLPSIRSSFAATLSHALLRPIPTSLKHNFAFTTLTTHPFPITARSTLRTGPERWTRVTSSG